MTTKNGLWNAVNDVSKSAIESVLSLDRLVTYWDGDSSTFTPEESMWGEMLRSRALDLGLRSVWESLPQAGKPMSLSGVEQLLGVLARRGVDLAHAHLLVEKNGDIDIYLTMPRAFPDLGIMSLPDPKRVGLIV